SLRICQAIDADAGRPLMPESLGSEVASELTIVDGTPHVALLYGAHPDVDVRPERLRRNMPGVHDRKLAKIRSARDQVADDPLLTAAFDAKIAKEEAARAFVATPAQMRSAFEETRAIVADLDRRLADGRRWACGEAFTLADVFWSVSLFRLAWLGMAPVWEGNHPLNGEERRHVSAYAQHLFARPTFRAAVVDWPLTPRSEHAERFVRS
nr:glutathione S-transferase C-terminal domain-containing protein [Myxococcales bacterium]